MYNNKNQSTALQSLEDFCQTLPHKVKPSIIWHGTSAEGVGGRTAILTVDFGYQYPLSRLNPHQNRELISLMRRAVFEYVDGVRGGESDDSSIYVNIESCTYLGLYYYASTYRKNKRGK